MKIKILESSGWYKHFVGSEFEVNKYEIDDYLRFRVEDSGWVYNDDCVITELPESFCVKRCDDNKKWYKYLEWLVKQKNYSISIFGRVFVGVLDGVIGKKLHYDDLHPFGTEIHIDDMIKHIEYMERHIKGGEQFHKESQLTVKMNKKIDLTTNEGRLAYAEKHYPIGTKYIPVYSNGESWGSDRIKIILGSIQLYGIDKLADVNGYIYANGKWAEIIKEEETKKENMNTQKLSRIGLEEIHSVACTSWKKTLVDWAKNRNIFKEYIELTQEEVNKMFDACTKEQLPIVSKYLKQDDKSVYLTNIKTDSDSIWLGDNCIITPRKSSEYENKAFNLNDNFKWEIKKDSLGILCLIPTKKK